MMLLRYVALAACITLCSASSAKTPGSERAQATEQTEKPICSEGAGSKKSDKIFTIPAIQIPITDEKSYALTAGEEIMPKRGKARRRIDYFDRTTGKELHLKKGDEVTNVKVLKKRVQFSYGGTTRTLNFGRWNKYFEPQLKSYYGELRPTTKQSFKPATQKTSSDVAKSFKQQLEQWKSIGQTAESSSVGSDFLEKHKLRKKGEREKFQAMKRKEKEAFKKDDEVLTIRKGRWDSAKILSVCEPPLLEGDIKSYVGFRSYYVQYSNGKSSRQPVHERLIKRDPTCTPKDCGECNGRGKSRKTVFRFHGLVEAPGPLETCQKCDGSGKAKHVPAISGLNELR